MLILDHILGQASDPALADRLHDLSHAGQVETPEPVGQRHPAASPAPGQRPGHRLRHPPGAPSTIA
ncbi:hypothetical protein ALP50_04109 [Pseudomonas syringae pv. spinaceae]|nr:hypothetical protein ALP50_04109 [Pseudomonas syringae pv. spinaceae]